MGWFRKKRKEVAETFVEDMTLKVKSNVKKTSQDYSSVALSLLPIVVGIVEIATLTGTASAPEALTASKHIVNYGTINIYNK